MSKHISDLSDRQFRRRIKNETEKVLRYVFENIKNDDDTVEGTRKGIIFTILLNWKIMCIMYDTIYSILQKTFLFHQTKDVCFKKKIILKIIVLLTKNL